MDPLLERGEELAALESVVEAARDGRGQLVLVAGEAGIGKTSLVRALRARLGERAAFLLGACEPLSVPVPLAPLREIVGAEASGSDGEDALALARLVLGALRARAPAVAVLEDAHWADPARLRTAACDSGASAMRRVAGLVTRSPTSIARAGLTASSSSR